MKCSKGFQMRVSRHSTANLDATTISPLVFSITKVKPLVETAFTLKFELAIFAALRIEMLPSSIALTS